MTDYGITASQEGIDLKEATDAQKTLDSRWRYLDILYEETIGFTNTSGILPRTNLFKHDLGFVPAFDVYNTTTDRYISTLQADEKYVYYQGEWDSFSEHTNCGAIIRIYNIPILEEFSAPITQTLTKGKSKSSSYGIKILNPNKSGELKDLEMTGFSLNTGSKGLAVHKTGTVTASPTTVTWQLVIQHGLGNPPIFMMAKCANDLSNVYALTTDFMEVMGKADTTQQMSFRGAQAAISGKYAYIIFKELSDFAA